MNDIVISQSEYNLENGKKGKLAVFMYTGKGDPVKNLDEAVFEYVGTNGRHELIDANLDNPWLRVVLSNINDMHQENFDSSKHHL